MRAFKTFASISPRVSDAMPIAVVFISLHASAVDVIEAIVDLPQTEFVAATVGESDISVEVSCVDYSELLETIQTIRGIVGESTIRTALYLDVLKYDDELPQSVVEERDPVPSKPQRDVKLAPLDDEELRIIDVLRNDGRASYSEVARALDLSYSSVRRKIIHLLDSGIVQIRTVMNPLLVSAHLQYGIGVRVEGDVRKVATEIGKHPEVNLVIAAAGAFDLLLEVTCEDRQELSNFLSSELRRIDGVRSLHANAYARVYKIARWARPEYFKQI